MGMFWVSWKKAGVRNEACEGSRVVRIQESQREGEEIQLAPKLASPSLPISAVTTRGENANALQPPGPE